MPKLSASLFVKTHSHSRAGTNPDTYWIPNTDVYACESGLVVKVELAGIRREDLELLVEGNQLKITGQRPDGCRPSKCRFLVMEINYGPFETVIELPPGYDLARARAVYQNGFLRIDVPVDDTALPRASVIPVEGHEK